MSVHSIQSGAAPLQAAPAPPQPGAAPVPTPPPVPRCLLCGAPGRGIVFPYGTEWNGRRFDFWSCSSCKSTFTHPLPTSDEIAAMYAKSEYHDEHYAELDDGGFARSLDAVSHLFEPGATILDYGCGNGAFLVAARRKGFVAAGVEVEAQAIRAAAESSGCEVFSPEELAASGRKYDVIHLGDVLEHLPDPFGHMRELRNHLRPGGLFFIEGPLEENASLVHFAARNFGRVKRLLGRSVYGNLPPFHLTRVTARAQRDFFHKRLGCRERFFCVSESGWPYRNSATSAAGLMKNAIARAAIAGSALGRLVGMKVGNRFTAVIEPQPDRS